MSGGPIAQERAGTVATPIPHIRVGDRVRILQAVPMPGAWRVTQTDHVTAVLEDDNEPGRKVSRNVRDLELFIKKEAR